MALSLSVLAERSHRAALVASLASATAARAERALFSFGELPGGWMLLQLAARRREEALCFQDYARQCEREFVEELFQPGRN